MSMHLSRHGAGGWPTDGLWETARTFATRGAAEQGEPTPSVPGRRFNVFSAADACRCMSADGGKRRGA